MLKSVVQTVVPIINKICIHSLLNLSLIYISYVKKT